MLPIKRNKTECRAGSTVKAVLFQFNISANKISLPQRGGGGGGGGVGVLLLNKCLYIRGDT